MARELLLAVRGIHGLQQADRVRHLLVEMPGVARVEARLDLGGSCLAARVWHEERQVSAAQVRSRLAVAGYQVEKDARRAQLTFTIATAPVLCVC